MLTKWWRFARQSVSIHSGTDVNGTIEDIRENVEIRRSNIWLLICSAILASIGLDLNSSAVIIGAMLISPLMSPILGVGLGFAIVDRNLLRRALGNLSLATALSIGASFLYFSLTPLGELTSELEARTTPTLLDVGVAFFGGVAGIVAGSRSKKTSAIPGVAIATALMPPICTAGFGLARGNSTIFLGAFYLYFINAFFIALATYLISKILRFPARAKLDEEQSVTVRRAIIGLAIIITLPSAIIFYGLIQKLRVDRGIRNFVNTEIRRDDRIPIRWDLDGEPGNGTLKIYCVGRGSEKTEIDLLRAAMTRYGLEGIDLRMMQMNVPRQDFERLASTVESDVTSQLRLLSDVVERRQSEIDELRSRLDAVSAVASRESEFVRQLIEGEERIENAYWETPATTPEGESSKTTRKLIVKFREGVSPGAVRAALAEIERASRIFWPFEPIEISEETNKVVEETETPKN